MTNRWPASVKETLRVVRLKSRTPSVRSSFPTALLSAVVETPSSSAAVRNLPRRATMRTASSSVRLLCAIVPAFVMRRPELSRLSRRSVHR